MSGNQESRISLPTWQCSDFNAAIPIKKRKYFVQPQLPVMEEAGSTRLEKILPSNEQSDISVGKSALDSSDANENQKMIGEPISSLSPVSVGNADKAKSIGNIMLDHIRVKVEEPNFPIHSSRLSGFEIPSSSNILDSSHYCSLGKLPVSAEHSGVAVTSVETGMKVEKTVLKTHDIVREACSKENLRGECQTEVSSGVSTVSMQLSFITKNSSPYRENEEPKSMNLSLSKGVCAPHSTDSISTCTKFGRHSNVNRSNWDLNTTMDAWEDAVDCTTRVKTTGVFLNNNRSLHDIDTSNFRDTTVIAKSDSEKQRETVTLMQFHHQVNPTCSLSLGLSPYPPIEKSLLSANISEARAASTSFSRPIVSAENLNSVNLKTVKSEVTEETVRQETESVQVCPIGISINGVKQEVVGRFSQENTPSSGLLKPVNPVSIKAEPKNFNQSEVFNRKDGTLNHPHTPIMQSNEILDLPTSSTSNQKDTCIPYSNGISNAPMSLNGMAVDLNVQSYPDILKENSGQSSSAANEKLYKVNVTSLTKEKTTDDCKTCIPDVPRNSRDTVQLSINDEEKIILSGKELEKELYSHGLESDSGHDLSRLIKKQVGKRSLYFDRKVQGPPAVLAESNEVAHAKCGGSETEQRDIAVPYYGDFQIPNHVEKENQPALLGNTVEMASTEVHIKRLTPEIQSRIFDGSGENEGRIVLDGEHSTQHIIHACEGTSGVSTVTGGNVDNPEIVDNSSPVSYKAEVSTIDNDSSAEFSEGSQSKIINLDASGSFLPFRMEKDRLPDFPLEPRKYLLRGSDESYKFSRGRYHEKKMRNPRLNFMPDRRRFSNKPEGSLDDRDTKNFEFDNHGNTRGGGAFMSNFHRGRRPANDGVIPFSHSFQRRSPSFSFTHREATNKEDASAFHGFRDGEKFTRRLQCNNTEPMFMSPQRPYQGRNGFVRGQTKFSNNPKRGFPRFRSRSPIRSRERSAGPSSSFRNRSQEDFSGHTDFSYRRSPSGYRRGRISSPEHSNYPRQMVVGKHNSPPYPHRPYAGRGRGYTRGRGYARGRGYGRDGISFRKPSDRVVDRNYGNVNNLDPRERDDYSDGIFERTNHSERFDVDVNIERRQFGYGNEGTSSFRPSFRNDGCAPTNAENNPDALRVGQDPDIETEEQESLMEIDGKDKNSAKNTFGRTSDMEDKETSKHSKIWQ